MRDEERGRSERERETEKSTIRRRNRENLSRETVRGTGIGVN